MPTDHPASRRQQRVSPVRPTIESTDTVRNKILPVANPNLPDEIKSVHEAFSNLHETVVALEAKLSPVLHDRVPFYGEIEEKEDSEPMHIAATVQSIINVRRRINDMTAILQNINSALALD